MVYASVIVQKKTRAEELTYSVPAQIIPYIKVGSRVVAPLRQGQVEAVVVGLSRRIDRELQSKIKPLIDINRSAVIYTPEQISVINRLADYYMTSLAQVAFLALGEPGSAIAGNPLVSRRHARPLFIQANRPARWAAYQRIIAKHFPKKNCLFIFAQRSLAADFYSSLPAKLREQVIFDDQKAAANRQLQHLVEKPKPFIIIGSLQRSFFPLKAGDVLVVDQPDHLGASYQQQPKLEAKIIGLSRSRVEQLQLVLGQELMAVEDYPNLTGRLWQLLAPAAQPQPLTLYDHRQARSFLLPAVEEILQQSLDDYKKILVITLAKGWAAAVICRKCHEVLGCPRCHSTISAASARQLHCHYCGLTIPWLQRCPNCRQPELQPIGQGSQQLTETLKKHWPTVNTQELSSDQPKLSPDSQLVVATEKILSYPQARFDQIIIANADRLIAGSQLDGHWRLIELILQLQTVSPAIAVQTNFPDHPLWGVIASGNWTDFYQSELALRRKLKLPPFGTMFQLGRPGVDRPKLLAEAEKLKPIIKSLLQLADLAEPEVTRLANRSWQINLPVRLPTVLSSTQKRRLKAVLPVPWFVDLTIN